MIWRRFSYASLLEWLTQPLDSDLETTSEGQDEEFDAISEAPDIEVVGPALLELHLQDYLFRNWTTSFPGLTLFHGANGREYVTTSPGVGILDFLATDPEGNFVVIETKKGEPDRKAIGQVLGYMGWVKAKLCPPDKSVRGILLCGEVSDQLRMAVSTVPSLELMTYEITFRVSPVP